MSEIVSTLFITTLWTDLMRIDEKNFLYSNVHMKIVIDFLSPTKQILFSSLNVKYFL